MLQCLVLQTSGYRSGRICPIEKKYPPVKNDDNKYIDHFYMHAQHRAQNLRAEEMVPCVLSCMRGGVDPVRA